MTISLFNSQAIFPTMANTDNALKASEQQLNRRTVKGLKFLANLTKTDVKGMKKAEMVQALLGKVTQDQLGQAIEME